MRGRLIERSERMPLSPLSAQSSARGPAALVLTALLAATANASLKAQTSAQYEGPACVASPTLPENDTWPVAVTDALEPTPSPQPVTFASAQLLSNDRPLNGVMLVSVASTSTRNGRITGANPFVYTPPAHFAGIDTFSYVISDALGETATGIVTVTVVDVTAPTVRITAPAVGTVSGVVTITASASDNVGVAAVTFFDGATQIGATDLKSPFSVTWDSTLASNGTHTLTATARDAAGNTATSAAVVVNVANTVTTLSEEIN
jgi:hypothetical protein